MCNISSQNSQFNQFDWRYLEGMSQSFAAYNNTLLFSGVILSEADNNSES